jgi:SAM-dependent methyltransferase
MSANAPDDLQRIYEARFRENLDYRRAVWRVLIDDFFQRYVRSADAVLDLGCGYGEFINQIRCGEKFAMDLNPDLPKRIGPEVKPLLQDCSARWPLPENRFDVVFTSNFFEHLPDKASLGRTLDEVHRCLKPGGCLIALGPNIKHLPGTYWDFWDHYLPLTETSLQEALQNRGYRIERCVGRFLPYTMASGWKYPLTCLRLFLRLPPAWRFVGKQFLVVARK